VRYNFLIAIPIHPPCGHPARRRHNREHENRSHWKPPRSDGLFSPLVWLGPRRHGLDASDACRLWRRLWNEFWAPSEFRNAGNHCHSVGTRALKPRKPHHFPPRSIFINRRQRSAFLSIRDSTKAASVTVAASRPEAHSGQIRSVPEAPSHLSLRLTVVVTPKRPPTFQSLFCDT
jgi:hypothetical protein